MKILILLIMLLTLLSCQPQGSSTSTSATNDDGLIRDVSEPLYPDAPEVPAGLESEEVSEGSSSTSEEATATTERIPLKLIDFKVLPKTPLLIRPVTSTDSTLKGSVQLQFDTKEVKFNQTFVIIIHNYSNKNAEINVRTLKMVGDITKRNYLAHWSTSTDSGCKYSFKTLAPGTGCAVTFINNALMAPDKGSMASLAASIDVRYEGEAFPVNVSSATNYANDNFRWITLMGKSK